MYLAHAEGRPAYVQEIAEQNGIAQVTALRWAGKLADMGLLARQPRVDQRRVDLFLTSEAETAVAAYLEAVAGPVA